MPPRRSHDLRPGVRTARAATLGVLALGLAACAPAPALAQTPAPTPSPASAPTDPVPVIAAGGSGEVRITPDRAAITFAIETRAPTAAAAGRENARIAKAVLDTLRAMGIPAADLGTSGYSVHPEQRFDPRTGRSTVSGYVARNGVRAQLTKTELVGPTIDAALAKGANVVAGLEFSASTTTQARREAIAAAVAEARGEAEAAARAAGGTLGPQLELVVSPEFERPDFPRPVAMRAMAGDEGATTPVEPGQQVVRAVVQGRWRFVPDGR